MIFAPVQKCKCKTIHNNVMFYSSKCLKTPIYISELNYICWTLTSPICFKPLFYFTVLNFIKIMNDVRFVS